MKKIALFLSAMAAGAGLAVAQPSQLSPLGQLPPAAGTAFAEVPFSSVAAASPAKVPAKAGEQGLSIVYSPAGEPYSFIGFKDAAAGDEYAYAVQIVEADATKFAGNEIKAINFYNGMNTQTRTNHVRSATVFLTYDLEEEPFMTQNVEMTDVAGELNEVLLDNPYEIEAGKSVFMGVKYAVTAVTDYGIVIDYLDHGSDVSGGYVATYKDGRATWDNIASAYGFVCVSATIAGDNMPQNQAAVGVYSYTPVACAGEEFSAELIVGNFAANDISSITLECVIGDLPPVTEKVVFPAPLPYDGLTFVSVPGMTYPTASPDPIEVKFTLTKVNDEDNNSEYSVATFPVQIIPEGSGYTRNVVIEEFTGIWCGYCPAGIVTMEAIREDYPDGSLIPVCVHVDDALAAASFTQVIELNSGGVPNALLNRSVAVHPGDYDAVISSYENLHAIPAVATISATAEFDATDDSKVNISTVSEFLFDMDDAASRYAIAFAVTEDNVGPYNQTNNYSGSGVDCGGWENLGKEVPTIYNDVARQLNKFSGLNGSVPETVKAGQPYEFDYALTLTSKIKDKAKIHIIVYLLNKQTGEIENACTIKAGNTGINQVGADSIDADVPVEYFNLQGVRVAEPSNGIFIRRQGNSVGKVLVK